MSEFDPIEHIWELQNLKNKEKDLRYQTYAIIFVFAVNAQVLIGTALTKGDLLPPAGTFFAEGMLAIGLAILRDSTNEKIESIQNLLDSLDATKTNKRIELETLIEIESENQIIIA